MSIVIGPLKAIVAVLHPVWIVLGAVFMALKRDARIQCRLGVMIKSQRDSRRVLIIVDLMQLCSVALSHS